MIKYVDFVYIFYSDTYQFIGSLMPQRIYVARVKLVINIDNEKYVYV